MSKENKFLVNDPDWAVDFAPNGKILFYLYRMGCSYVIGTLLQLGDIITRKRYAA